MPRRKLIKPGEPIAYQFMEIASALKQKRSSEDTSTPNDEILESH